MRLRDPWQQNEYSIEYTLVMFTVKALPEFTSWLGSLRDGNTLVLMLGGGDKSTQTTDVAKAIALAQNLEGTSP